MIKNMLVINKHVYICQWLWCIKSTTQWPVYQQLLALNPCVTGTHTFCWKNPLKWSIICVYSLFVYFALGVTITLLSHLHFYVIWSNQCDKGGHASIKSPNYLSLYLFMHSSVYMLPLGGFLTFSNKLLIKWTTNLVGELIMGLPRSD